MTGPYCDECSKHHPPVNLGLSAGIEKAEHVAWMADETERVVKHRAELRASVLRFKAAGAAQLARRSRLQITRPRAAGHLGIQTLLESEWIVVAPLG